MSPLSRRHVSRPPRGLGPIVLAIHRLTGAPPPPMRKALGTAAGRCHTWHIVSVVSTRKTVTILGVLRHRRGSSRTGWGSREQGLARARGRPGVLKARR